MVDAKCENSLIEKMTERISNEIGSFLQDQTIYKENIDLLKQQLLHLQEEFLKLLVKIDNSDSSQKIEGLKEEYTNLVTEITKVNLKLDFYEKELTSRFYRIDKTIKKSFTNEIEIKGDIEKINEELQENKEAVEFVTKKTLGEPYEDGVSINMSLKQRVETLEKSIDVLTMRLFEAETLLKKLLRDHAWKRGLQKLLKPVKSLLGRAFGHIVIKIIVYLGVLYGLSPKVIEFFESLLPYFESLF
jgi:hypothetical protein